MRSLSSHLIITSVMIWASVSIPMTWVKKAGHHQYAVGHVGKEGPTLNVISSDCSAQDCGGAGFQGAQGWKQGVWAYGTLNKTKGV